MLRLKGQTESGEWVEFWVYDIINNDETWTGVWCVSPSRPDEWKKYDDIVTATIQPADDQRKQMLDEIREKINNLTEYKTFVRVEGDPVPTLPQIAKWCVIWILDEMEAKL